MHVFEWDIRRCPIYVHTIIWAWFITALLRPSIHERWPQLVLLSFAIESSIHVQASILDCI